MSKGDMTLSTPEWVNKSVVELSLRRACGDQQLEVEKMDVKPACSRGTGFFSDMFRVTATVKTASGQTEQRSLIFKALFVSGPMRGFIQATDLYAKETLVYTVMLPAIEDAAKAAEIKDWTPLSAKCYHSSSEPTDFLVLEDLVQSGFTMAEKGKLLDKTHCSLALKSLARVHAGSILLQNHESFTRESFSQHPMFTPVGKQLIVASVGGMIGILTQYLATQPGLEKMVEKYSHMQGDLCESLESMIKACKPQLKVLVHGDLWKNNMMFKYEDAIPTDVKLLDYQNSFWGSPAMDIWQFLGTSADLEVHQKHLDSLLEDYHGTLQSSLRALGLQQQADAYPLQELRREIDHFALYGFFMMTAMVPMVLARENIEESSDDMIENSGQQMALYQKLLSSKEFLSHLAGLLPIFEKLGVI